MQRLIIPPGTPFGRLKVVSETTGPDNRRRYFICACECGTVKTVDLQNLRMGYTQSCGCIQRESCTTHGMSNSPTHRSWSHMLQRCTNPNFQQYPDYGGRGIKVCKRWKQFENFLVDMGKRPSLQHSIDRYPNNDGDYEPGNCRWADHMEQHQNTRKSVHVMFKGERLSMSEFARRIGVPRSTALSKIRCGAFAGGSLVTR